MNRIMWLHAVYTGTVHMTGSVSLICIVLMEEDTRGVYNTDHTPV